MNIYELEIIVGDDFNQTTRLMYFDIDKIAGFYIGETEVVNGDEVKPIFAFCQGDFLAIMPDAHIQEYLIKTFVKPSKRLK